jgi:hypothetical protein
MMVIRELLGDEDLLSADSPPFILEPDASKRAPLHPRAQL